MYSIVITIVAVVCAFNLLMQKISNRALLRWIHNRCGELPGPEIEECVKWAVIQTFSGK